MAMSGLCVGFSYCPSEGQAVRDAREATRPKVALELRDFEAQHYYLRVFLDANGTRKLEGYIIRRMLMY